MGRWKTVGGQAAAGKITNVPDWVGHDASERVPIYTRGNAGEVYPEVFTPLSFSIASETGERAMRNAVLGSGLISTSELEDIPLTTGVANGVFGGYAYLNLTIQRLLAARARRQGDRRRRQPLGVGEPPPHEPLARSATSSPA